MNIKIEVVEKPARKAVIKRGVKATDHFAYCEEVGCDVWDALLGMEFRIGEPVSMWLPECYRKPETSTYVQGVEAAADDHGPIPEGFDVIKLPAATYLMFHSEPFADEDFCQAIEAVQAYMDAYDPSALGYQWDDENPRIHLEPWGARGYMEFRAVKK